MYTIAVTVLLGLALVTLVDAMVDLAPGVHRGRGLVTIALAIAGAFALDYSLFEGFGVALRQGWMGTFLTGVVVAGTTSVWRAALGWLGAPDEEPERRHTGGGLVTKAA